MATIPAGRTGAAGEVMSKLRTYGLAAALLVLLSGNARAASRDDDSRDGIQKFSFNSNSGSFRIVEDMKPTCPPR